MSATPPAGAFHASIDTSQHLAADSFVASLAHELRTPLNAVIGFGECIATGIAGDLDAKYRAYGEHIVDAGRRLLDVVDDVLQLPLPGGKHANVVLHDVVQQVRRGAEHGIDASLLVWTDARLLLQMLRWLLPPDPADAHIFARRHAEGAVELVVIGEGSGAAKPHRRSLLDSLAVLCGAQLTHIRDPSGVAAVRLFFPSTT